MTFASSNNSRFSISLRSMWCDKKQFIDDNRALNLLKLLCRSETCWVIIYWVNDNLNLWKEKRWVSIIQFINHHCQNLLSVQGNIFELRLRPVISYCWHQSQISTILINTWELKMLRTAQSMKLPDKHKHKGNNTYFYFIFIRESSSLGIHIDPISNKTTFERSETYMNHHKQTLFRFYNITTAKYWMCWILQLI